MQSSDKESNLAGVFFKERKFRFHLLQGSMADVITLLL